MSHVDTWVSRKRAQLESPQGCAWKVWETAGEASQLVQVGSRLLQPGRVKAGAKQKVGVNAQGAVAILAAGCSRRANKREHPGQLG